MSTTAQAVEQFLAKIDQTKDLNIFLEVWADEARAQAQKSMKKLLQERQVPLREWSLR